MSGLVVSKECIRVDEERFSQAKNRLLNNKNNQQSEGIKLLLSAVEGSSEIQQIDGTKPIDDDEIYISIFKTSYMLREFHVFTSRHFPNQPGILLRMPCAHLGVSIGYREFKDIIAFVCKTSSVPTNLMVILLKALDRYIPDPCCEKCKSDARDFVFTLERNTSEGGIETQLMEVS